MSNIMKKVLAFVVNVPPLLGLIAWPFMVLLSLFFFDAPGATGSLPTLGLAFSIWGYPLPVVIGLCRTWKALRANDHAGCVRGVLVAYGGLILFGVMAGIIAVACGGKFAC